MSEMIPGAKDSKHFCLLPFGNPAFVLRELVFLVYPIGYSLSKVPIFNSLDAFKNYIFAMCEQHQWDGIR